MVKREWKEPLEGMQVASYYALVERLEALIEAQDQTNDLLRAVLQRLQAPGA